VPGDDFAHNIRAAMSQARATIAVVSDAYLESPFAEAEWAAALDANTLLPVRVSGERPPGHLGFLDAVHLVGLDEQEARVALRDAAERFLRPARAKPVAPAAFPRPTAERPVAPPTRFPATISPFVAIDLEVTVTDVLEIRADVVAFKHASGFYGADSAAATLLRAVGYSYDDLAAERGEHRLVESRDALGSRSVLFVGVGPLGMVGYEEIKLFGRRVVEIAAAMPGTRHLALTAHGRGIGLDEEEAFLSQVAGFLDCLQQRGAATELQRITVVERVPERADIFGRTLKEHLGEIPYAWLQERSGHRWQFGIGATQEPAPAAGAEALEPQPIRLLERNPEDQPHVFIAYPFELEDHARFGIERPARDAGYLSRLIGDQVYTGEVLARIKDQIESAVLVVAVLTNANANVYLEVGYAWGRGKPTLLVADESEQLRFDVAGYRAIKYANISDLERKFAATLPELVRDADTAAGHAKRDLRDGV
jgi:TIR domain